MLYKSNDINEFGFYKILTLEPYITDPTFFVVTVDYIDGNGSMLEDKDYMMSLVSLKEGSAPTKTSDLINDGDDGINPFISLEDITGFVPYVGATEDVDLGEFGLKTGNIEFDITPTVPPVGEGSMYWSDSDGTANMILKGGNVTLQVGQEQVVRVVNKTDPSIDLFEADYQAVRITGAQGQRLKVDLAQGSSDSLSAETIGLVTETIDRNQEGFITTSGLVRGINTTGDLQGEIWNDGDIVYLSPTIAGNITNIKPVAPEHLVIIGYVVRAHVNQGSIFVKVNNGYELEELHNVSANDPNNDDALVWDSFDSLWKPKPTFQLPLLSPGSVLFSNGSGISEDNLDFFWDDTNKRLGLGTTSPTAKLHIAAPGALSTDIALKVRNSADTADILQVRGNGNVGIGSGGAENKLTVYGDNATFALRVGQNTANFDGVWTGISFYNSTNTGGGSTGTGQGNIKVYRFSGGLGGEMEFNIGATSTSVMRLSRDANVLIGTTIDIPSSKLTVASTTQGFLPPRMTNAQRDAIVDPADGLMIWNSENKTIDVYESSSGWRGLAWA